MIKQETLRKGVGVAKFDFPKTFCNPIFMRNGFIMVRHKAGQEGRGEILFENSFMR